jgi:pyridoxamine 5'-phosphate oxidase
MDNVRKHIAQLREDFIKGELNEKDIAPNPFQQFEKWMKEAVEANVLETQAMQLATVNRQGFPSSRTVYLREYNNHQFIFYTNFESRKGNELAENNRAACLFFWPELERQIRIEGSIKKASDKVSDAYFNARPRESQISAWASPQSQLLKSRGELEERIAMLEKQFEGKPIPRPDFWGGYVLTAHYYEFWQGRKSRRHDRLVYEQDAQYNWQIQRLAP